MPSTQAERLELIYSAFKSAFKRRAQDLKEAKSASDANKIIANVDRLELAYLRAAKQALDGNAASVEAAYAAAAAAKEAVDAAYLQARSVTERIGLVGDLAGKIGDLITKAKAIA